MLRMRPAMLCCAAVHAILYETRPKTKTKDIPTPASHVEREVLKYIPNGVGGNSVVSKGAKGRGVSNSSRMLKRHAQTRSNTLKKPCYQAILQHQRNTARDNEAHSRAGQMAGCALEGHGGTGGLDGAGAGGGDGAGG